jgi:hypothetical protein
MVPNSDNIGRAGTMPKDDVLLDEVRTRIESKYRAALEGLEAIRGFLGESMNPQDSANKGNNANRNVSSYRERVLAVMNDKWHTVADLASLSGLEAPAVRGVLYAKNLEATIKKKKKRGRAYFKLEGGGAR